MIAEHSTSGVRTTILGPAHWLWCLLFGAVYYAAKGMWGAAILSFLTFNGLFFIFPVINKGMVRKHYESLGWKILD